MLTKAELKKMSNINTLMLKWFNPKPALEVRSPNPQDAAIIDKIYEELRVIRYYTIDRKLHYTKIEEEH